MQKKLIALAVAAISAAPAFAADTSVTLYGVMDVGYTNRTSNYLSTVSGRNGFDSGIGNGSRLGFKGVEDLGGGLKAVFQVEAGILADQGASDKGTTTDFPTKANGSAGATVSRTWGRQAFGGIDTSGGLITIGRHYSPLYDAYAATEPFGLGNVGELNNIFQHVTSRYDNSLRYKSPWFGDVFAVDALYSLKASGPEALGNVGDQRAFVLLPKLKFGPATLFAAYQQQKVKDASTSNTSFDIAGVYDFKVVQLSAGYARVKYDANPVAFTPNLAIAANTIKAPKHDRFFIGGNVPFGNFSLKASYAFTKSKSDGAIYSGTVPHDTFKANLFALGGRYAVSKRTDFYATFSSITGNAAGQVYDTGDATQGTGLGYKRGFDLGFKHTF